MVFYIEAPQMMNLHDTLTMLSILQIHPLDSEFVHLPCF